MTSSTCILVASLLITSAADAANEGVPVNGLPNYQERAVLTLTNAVRMAPSQFRDAYLPAGNGGILNDLPVSPVFGNAQLNLAARNHALDMANNNYFSHTSLNGMSWVQRLVAAGYTGTPMGENIAAGQVTPLDVVKAWLLSSGHRTNIMNPASKELGTGYGYNVASTYDRYWVQDFGTRVFTVQSPIVCGSHVIPSAGNIRFLLAVDDPAVISSPPQSVRLVLQGTVYPMNLHMGISDRGTYERTLTTATTCRSYHFELVSAQGGFWRYPASGEFLTATEGGCTQDFQPGSPPPPPPVPGDVTGNGVVNIDDIMAVIAAWGACPSPPQPGNCPTDISPSGPPQGNGIVNIDDLLMVVANWS